MDNENKATIELRFAWRQKQQEIDEFVQRLPSANISTAFIAAQHAAGKSTTLLAHISDLMQHNKDLEKTSIIYVVPSEVERSLLSSFVLSKEFKPDTEAESCFSLKLAPAKVYIATFGGVVQGFESMISEACGQGSSLLFVLDLEISPTTNGEVLLGLAMEWAAARAASPHIKGNGLMVLSPYISPRTIEAPGRVVGRHPNLIQVPRVEVNVGKELLEDNELEHIKRLLSGNQPGNHRVLLHAHPDWEWNLAHAQAKVEWLHGDDAQKVSNILSSMTTISMDHDFPCSFTVNGLTHVVTSYEVSVPCFRGEVMQPVTQIRNTTQLEELRQLSWAHKAKVPADVKFYKPQDSFATSLSPGIDVPGPAFLACRYQTVLEFVARWPGRAFTQMPTRLPQDLHMLRNICQKLELFGCIANKVRDGQPVRGVYEMTEFGERLLDLWRAKDFEKLDIHVLHLLVTAVEGMASSAWSTNLIRVALRLAAIMSIGYRSCGKDDPNAPLSLLQLRQQCAGVGQDQAALGGHWTTLGIWQKARSLGQITATNDGLYRNGGVRSNGLLLFEALALVESLEDQLGLNKVVDEVAETALNGDEIQLLEDALLGAWIDQVAVYIGHRHKWYEASCCQEVEVSKSEFLDTATLARQEQFSHGCSVIYSKIQWRNDAFVISNLTAVPRRAIRKVADKTGRPFSQAIASHYPTAL